jgi:hypothetical protein
VLRRRSCTKAHALATGKGLACPLQPPERAAPGWRRQRRGRPRAGRGTAAARTRARASRPARSPCPRATAPRPPAPCRHLERRAARAARRAGATVACLLACSRARQLYTCVPPALAALPLKAHRNHTSWPRDAYLQTACCQGAARLSSSRSAQHPREASDRGAWSGRRRHRLGLCPAQALTAAGLTRRLVCWVSAGTSPPGSRRRPPAPASLGAPPLGCAPPLATAPACTAACRNTTR